MENKNSEIKLNIGKIKSKYDGIFIVGLTYLIENGIKFCKNITDNQIDNDIEKNSFMSKEYIQSIVRCARELSDYNAWDLISYIKEYVPIQGCINWKQKAKEYKEAASNAISLGQLDERFDKENLCYELEIDEEMLDEITDGYNAYREDE